MIRTNPEPPGNQNSPLYYILVLCLWTFLILYLTSELNYQILSVPPLDLSKNHAEIMSYLAGVVLRLKINVYRI